MHNILQVVDAFYASLQIRCTAHNLRIAEVTEYKITYQKGPTFFFRCVLLYTANLSGAASVSLKKSIVRDACILPLGAKCGRFCVLMQGRACIRTVGYLSFGLQQQSPLRVGRTEARIHPI